jgi:hypothetical protein
MIAAVGVVAAAILSTAVMRDSRRQPGAVEARELELAG